MSCSAIQSCPGEPGIDDAVCHVPRHLLGTDQHALQLAVVGAREIGAGADVDVPAGAGKQLHGGVLQGALGDAEAKAASRSPREAADGSAVADEAVALTLDPGQHRVRVAVNRRTTFRRLPDVSPFVQSALRVRLKKVTNPVSRVRCRASSFMKPTISTSLLESSCTTAGTSPSSLEKSIGWFLRLRSGCVSVQQKTPPSLPAGLLLGVRGLLSPVARAILRAGVAVAVMAMRAMEQGGHEAYKAIQSVAAHASEARSGQPLTRTSSTMPRSWLRPSAPRAAACGRGGPR